jgi:SAM-dependent methyltransferase
VRFYQVNTQPSGKGDNDNLGQEITRWDREPELVRLLQAHEFDVIFVDGKHTEDGLLNDLETFWPFLKSGGLMICDDIHDPAEYDGIFSWVPDTWQSFHTFIQKHCGEIKEHYIWNFPRVPPAEKSGLRPFGLIQKTSCKLPITTSPGFEMFDSEDALLINRARQDHLASLGLDLARQSVLEVGAGVGWHTAFFEKLGCTVISTDARPRNVEEHLLRYPYRGGRVEVVDLTVPGSHDQLGEFDIVYCYGTLYHLGDPALCIRDLSRICRKIFLLESCVNSDDNGKINPVSEDDKNPNQSFHGAGCRPGRDWVMAELRKHFPFVYIATTQPDHPDFPVIWPAAPPPGFQNTRAVFVASRRPLDLPTVSLALLLQQRRLRPIKFCSD